MKAIEKPIEWYQSKKGHCDALIKDIVLSGNKGHGESKVERSKLEETFIEDMENLKVHLGRLKAKGDLPSKLAEAIKVLAMVAKWGIGNNDDIIKVIENIKNSLEEQARSAKEEDIQPSLELLEKQAPLKNTIAVINFKQIKGILTRRVKEQAKNTKELSISLEKNQNSVYEILDLRFMIAEFLEDVRDRVIFLFSLSQSLSIDSKIKGNLNLYPYRDVITSRVFKDLMNKTLRLKEVSLSACKQLVNDDIEAWVKQHTTLTSLDLSDTKITNEGLEALAKHCKNLTSLNLGSCRQITDKGLKALAENCSNLTSLDLYHTKINDVGLKAVAPYLGNLTSLRLDDTKITDKGLKALAPYLGNLTSLNLNWYGALSQNLEMFLGHTGNRITDDGLEALAPHLGNLISLSLRGCYRITNKGLKALAKNCKNLTSLSLRGCYRVTIEGLRSLEPHLRKLTSLDLSYTKITDEGIKALAPYLGSLTSLELSETKITDEGLKALAPSLRKLTCLNLGATDITDEGLAALAENYKNLTSLDLSWCIKITDEGLKALAPSLRKLTRLNLGATDITDEGLAALAENYKNLTVISCVL